MKNRVLKYLGYGFVAALLFRKKHSFPEDVLAPEPSKPARPAAQPLTGPVPALGHRPGGVFGYFKKTFQEFSADDCMTQAAAIAYYTVFSLPPLLLLIIAIVGLV